MTVVSRKAHRIHSLLSGFDFCNFSVSTFKKTLYILAQRYYHRYSVVHIWDSTDSALRTVRPKARGLVENVMWFRIEQTSFRLIILLSGCKMDFCQAFKLFQNY
ncbi:Hypothetical_protein [Hexamita inflata]|uniref:Hypothetical_protein n=1 Tax=Hexamita inflata TaxID=28002 RepID=A0AA86UVY1_9EUKA|nr:Hypothetical protein HINF_LOCUS61575 [Hexamita inflata]